MILDACQQLLNRNIAQSTAAKHHIVELEGKRLAIEIEGLSVRLVLLVERGSIVLSVDEDSPASVTLKAAPLDLLSLAGPEALGRLKATRAELNGEIHVAEEFAELLRLAAPDLEEELSHWIGDIAAHEIGRAARGFARWSLGAGHAVETDVAEYLQEESGALPAPMQARRFYSDVDRLRDDVERAAQRVDRLVGAVAVEQP